MSKPEEAVLFEGFIMQKCQDKKLKKEVLKKTHRLLSVASEKMWKSYHFSSSIQTEIDL